ncbi:MAG: tetratricopeptide repeat protein [Pseudomonadota bacterium]
MLSLLRVATLIAVFVLAQGTIASERPWPAGAENNLRRALAMLAAPDAADKYGTINQFLKESAEHGVPLAQFHLAVSYLYGRGVEKDPEAAYEWYRRAAEQGLAGAQNGLAGLYDGQGGVEPDVDAALMWYEAAASQGHRHSIAALLFAYDNNHLEPPNSDTVPLLRRQAAALGDGNAIVFIAEGLLEKRDEKSVKEAIDWLTHGAERGAPEAQTFLGTLYADGNHVRRDEEEAARWLRKAADQESTAAMTRLAALYMDSRSVVADPAEGERLLLDAAKTKDPDALVQLSKFFLARARMGAEGFRDGAVELLRTAQAKGNSEASLMLWQLGEDVDSEAVLLGLVAEAADGNAESALTLGSLYYVGERIDRDFDRAIDYTMEAADKGSPLAQNLLSAIYLDPDNPERDTKKALTWLERAASHPGNFDSHNKLAWLLATHPDAELRDGPRAVELMLAMPEKHMRAPALLDTLAAAYAEAGRFEEAVDTQLRAIRLTETYPVGPEPVQAELLGILRGHLALFESNQPVREEP